MARPKVFISSTFYDLKHARDSVSTFITELGYEPILFERGGVAYGSKEPPEAYCYKEIKHCDILLSIIGGRYGAESQLGTHSITQKELQAALNEGKQVYIFIDKNVKAEYETYKLNKDNSDIKFKHVDNPKIYTFIEEIHLLPRNNPIFTFEIPTDIISIIKDQWSGLFQRLLQREAEEVYNNVIGSLQNVTSSLEVLVTQFSKNLSGSLTPENISMNHPAFLSIRKLLSIKHRVLFLSINELKELLIAYRYNEVYSDAWDDPDTMEWLSIAEHDGIKSLLKVSSEIFNSDDKLIPILQEDWDDDYIALSSYDTKTE